MAYFAPGPIELLIIGMLCAGFIAGLVAIGAVLYWNVRRVPPGMVRCTACGRTVSERAETCPHCGDPQNT